MATTRIDLTEVEDDEIYEIAEKHSDKKITGDWIGGNCEIGNLVSKRCNQAFIAGIMFAMQNITTEVEGDDAFTTVLTDVYRDGQGSEDGDMVFTIKAKIKLDY